MPEGVLPYRRWGGAAETSPRWLVVAGHEMRQSLRGIWSLLAVLAGLAWGLASVIELVQNRSLADAAWVRDAYLSMLEQLRWTAAAVAVVIGASLVLDDLRAGATELYLTRDLTRGQYLLGKGAALFLLTAGTMAAASLLYYLASLGFYDGLPNAWHGDAAWGLVYAVAWGLLVSGVALGASCALRSMAGSMLTVAGVFAGLDVIVRRLLGELTEEPAMAVASPFAAVDQAATWMWGGDPHGFPALWGLAAWLGLTFVGWALAMSRNPRPRGE